MSTTTKAIAEIGLDDRGALFVRPKEPAEYSAIHRDASGIRWDAERRALVAAEPERWEPAALFAQIVSAVRREYGDALALVPETRWNGIDEALRRKIVA
jgi:hypothetical protein